jgi:hypothetical protein
VLRVFGGLLAELVGGEMAAIAISPSALAAMLKL